MADRNTLWGHIKQVSANMKELPAWKKGSPVNRRVEMCGNCGHFPHEGQCDLCLSEHQSGERHMHELCASYASPEEPRYDPAVPVLLEAVRRVSAAVGHPYVGDTTKSCVDLADYAVKELESLRRRVAELEENLRHHESDDRYISDFLPALDNPMTVAGIKRAMEYSETCTCFRCDHARHLMRLVERVEAAEQGEA